MAVVENAGNKVGSSSGNSESADTKDFGQSQPSNHTVMQNLQQKNTNSKPILLPNDENYYSQKIPQFQQKAGSNGVAKIQMVGSFGRDREDGGDIRDLEDLLSKLNPMAEEFVPPSLANGHGWSAGAAFGYTNNFVLQANFGNANGNAGRRVWFFCFISYVFVWLLRKWTKGKEILHFLLVCVVPYGFCLFGFPKKGRKKEERAKLLCGAQLLEFYVLPGPKEWEKKIKI